MSFLSSAFILAAVALVAQGAPTADLSLAKKYAPQWRFHTNEIYYPSTIEFFLSNVDLVDSNNNVIQANPTVSTVDDAPNKGSGLYLATDVDANRNGWLKGQNPATSPSPVYTFVAPKDNGVVDLYYWLWTPFNAGKDVPLVGRVGDHVGDWERMAVRTVNGLPTAVDYHAHSDTGSTVPWASAPKFDNDQRPVGYIAQGSHGIWQTAGTHTYVNAVIFKLNDLTSDGGVAWDTQSSIVALDFPGTFSGDLDWLNYQGEFGNKGETSCWWHFAYDECEVVDGPPGPYRTDVMDGTISAIAKAKTNVLKTTASTNSSGSQPQIKSADPAKFDMTGSFSQVLGTPSSSEKSSFTVYLGDSADAKFVGVQQVCESAAATSGQNKTAITRRDVKRETKNTIAVAPFSKKVTATPAACASGSRVAAYTVALCTTDSSDSCSFSASSERPLRAYGKDGVEDSAAIDVEDLINWNL